MIRSWVCAYSYNTSLQLKHIQVLEKSLRLAAAPKHLFPS